MNGEDLTVRPFVSFPKLPYGFQLFLLLFLMPESLRSTPRSLLEASGDLF